MSSFEKKEEVPVPSEEEIIERIRKIPGVEEYLSQFRANSAQDFLKSYASEVHHVLKLGPQQEEMERKLPLQFLETAEELFWEIQQKKLFNLQCLWRAEKVEVPGLESTWDFEYWGHYIESCPFISPVTQEEVDLYISYLLSGQREDSYGHPDYQNYEEFRSGLRNPDEGEEYPEWYRYYDLRMGTSSLLILPDIRGEKEEIYLRISREQRDQEYKRKVREEEVEGIVQDTRPWLFAGSQEFMAFAEKFDDDRVKKYLRRAIRKNEEEYDYDHVWDAFLFLQHEVDEYISFEPHYDWREQVLLTVKKYKNEKFAAAVSQVYDGYRMRIETGIGYPHRIDYSKDIHGNLIDTHCLSFEVKKNILKGRMLNGEPENWDF